jgi:hypothetical protein
MWPQRYPRWTTRGFPDEPPGRHKLEVAVLPVADADRTKAFYTSLGWREDGDVRIGDD